MLQTETRRQSLNLNFRILANYRQSDALPELKLHVRGIIVDTRTVVFTDRPIYL